MRLRARLRDGFARRWHQCLAWAGSHFLLALGLWSESLPTSNALFFTDAQCLVPLNQLQPLQTRMPVLADDDVVVHGDAERRGDVDDRAGHLDIGLRWRRIAGGMVVHQQDRGGG